MNHNPHEQCFNGIFTGTSPEITAVHTATIWNLPAEHLIQEVDVAGRQL